MMSETQSLGQFVGSLKASRDLIHDREAFVKRSQRKYDTPSLADLEMVGLGGSCGKPAFALPFVVRFDKANTRRLEQGARAFDMFVEYGAYPHLKLSETGQEIAAVQDWTRLTLLFMRPSYARKEELARVLKTALEPEASAPSMTSYRTYAHAKEEKC